MKITDLLKKDGTSLSFEFFPPKNVELEKTLFDTIESLKQEKADFASVTFGAGGTVAGKTLDWTKRIKNTCNVETMMHLTCVGFSAEMLDSILEELENAGIENVLALRGDIPKDLANFPAGRDFTYASDMVAHVAQKGKFCIGCAGYPEIHPESPNHTHDIEMLKRKVENGASFIVTQLFFNNDKFFAFRDKCAQVGIHVPIVAGIMPIVSASQVIRFTQMCNTEIPLGLLKRIEGRPDDEVIKIGIEYAADQCQDLIRQGVSGVHFYTLNRSMATSAVLKELKF